MVQIEFGLPNGAGGMAAMHSSGHLRTQLNEWARTHNIAIETTIQRHDHRAWLQVTFNNDRDYTLFALSFTYKSFMGWQRL